jgi:predicted RNA binding protein YcfA (HicA-like mRNA interferase family)
MTLDYSRLRTITARKIVSALHADDFVLDRQRGSHRRYVHPDGRAVTVSFHRPSDTYTFKTLRSMIEVQARWSEEDLIRLKPI